MKRDMYENYGKAKLLNTNVEHNDIIILSYINYDNCLFSGPFSTGI